MTLLENVRGGAVFRVFFHLEVVQVLDQKMGFIDKRSHRQVGLVKRLHSCVLILSQTFDIEFIKQVSSLGFDSFQVI